MPVPVPSTCAEPAASLQDFSPLLPSPCTLASVRPLPLTSTRRCTPVPRVPVASPLQCLPRSELSLLALLFFHIPQPQPTPPALTRCLPPLPCSSSAENRPLPPAALRTRRRARHPGSCSPRRLRGATGRVRGSPPRLAGSGGGRPRWKAGLVLLQSRSDSDLRSGRQRGVRGAPGQAVGESGRVPRRVTSVRLLFTLLSLLRARLFSTVQSLSPVHFSPEFEPNELGFFHVSSTPPSRPQPLNCGGEDGEEKRKRNGERAVLLTWKHPHAPLRRLLRARSRRRAGAAGLLQGAGRPPAPKRRAGAGTRQCVGRALPAWGSGEGVAPQPRKPRVGWWQL